MGYFELKVGLTKTSCGGDLLLNNDLNSSIVPATGLMGPRKAHQTFFMAEYIYISRMSDFHLAKQKTIQVVFGSPDYRY